MDERVMAFLAEKQQEIETKKEERKKATLISLGLYEKVYSPDGNYTSEYNIGEWDNKEQTNKYFKKVPIDVTEEEYEEIQKYSKANNTNFNDTNPIATALSVIAWIIFFGGFIAGIVFGNVEISGTYYDYEEFSFAIALTYWAISLISGIMMLGFAEIVKLLNDIKNKN